MLLPAAPGVFALAADPVRWALLRALAHSDRRVSELCGLLERPQNLVSYHLGKLRRAGIVARRRSSADGRDSYYLLDLGRCGSALAEGGQALHPALRLRPEPSPTFSSLGGTRVLFLCTGNSARSQIAEAFAREQSSGALDAFSAGSQPKPLHPSAVSVMHGYGVDLAGASSKHLSEFAGRRFDYVVTLCDRVREVCPEFPGVAEQIHWSVVDPARGDHQEFERAAEEISLRVRFLLELIEHRPVEVNRP